MFETCGRLRIQSIKERWKRPRRWEARLEMVTPDLNYSSPPPSSPSLCPESDCSNYLQLLQKIDFQRLGRFCPNMPLGVVYTREKENLLAHQKWACASNFCEPNFQEFRLKWWRKELFLHCGDELNGLRPSWMVLTHGNVIFDIPEPSAFQKYSICWVFRALFCSTFFYMYFATQPRTSLTAVCALQGSRYFEDDGEWIWEGLKSKRCHRSHICEQTVLGPTQTDSSDPFPVWGIACWGWNVFEE